MIHLAPGCQALCPSHQGMSDTGDTGSLKCFLETFGWFASFFSRCFPETCHIFPCIFRAASTQRLIQQ